VKLVRVAGDVLGPHGYPLGLGGPTSPALDPLPGGARHLRRVLIHDQADGDAIASQLLRYRDGHGDDWADIIDFLTMHPEERRRVVRLLGEIDAG
jgi:hypothetical protein